MSVHVFLRRASVLLAVLVLLLGSPVPAWGQGGEAWRETFDDPALPGWEHTPNVTAEGGFLRVEPDGFAFHGGVWQEGTLSILARFQGDANVVFSFRAGDVGSYHVVLVSRSFVVLQREDAGRAPDELGQAPLAAPLDENWFWLTVVSAGEQLSVALNGVLLVTAADPAPLPPGGFGVEVLGPGVLELDEVRWEATDAAPSPSELGQPEAQPTALPAPTSGAQPAYTAESWVRLGGPPGGLGYDIRMKPGDPDVMFVTASPGGIFKSTDGGQWWVPVNKGIEPFPGAGANIFTVTVNPHNPDEVWVGTQFTGHIFRSEDGGQTWTRSDDGVRETSAENSIRGITFDPNDPNVVYMAMERGAEDVFQGTRGEVYKSTDGGAHWSLIWQGDNLARYVWVDPRDSQRLYVSTGFFDRVAYNMDEASDTCGGVGVVRSTDGGQTWEVLDQDNGLEAIFIPSLFMHPTNPDILIAAGIHATDNLPRLRCTGDAPVRTGVYATYDGGDTWQLILPTPPDTLDIQAVEIATADPNIWYAAGPDQFFRSEDGGQTWQKFTLRTADRGSGFPVDIEVDPRDPNRVFVNSYGGGNMLSTDGGRTWVDASAGYTGAAVYGLDVPAEDAATVLAGAETTTFVSRDGGFHWAGMGTGEESAPSMAILHYTDANGARHVLAATLSGTLYRSDDGGQTWQQVPLRYEEGLENAGLLGAVLLSVPEAPQTLFVGFSERGCLIEDWPACGHPVPPLFRSRDGGQTWQPLHGAPFDGRSIFDMAMGADGKLYVATLAGLFVSADQGESWQQMDTLDVPQQPVLPELSIPPVVRIAADPFDAQRLYAGTFTVGLWVSTDGGQTWQQAVGVDPNVTPSRILPDPHHQGVVYVATAHGGIFYSTDSGQRWQPLNQGLNFRDFRNLALSADGSVLYAASQGAGVFRLGTPAGG